MFIFSTVIYSITYLAVYQMIDDREKGNDCELSPF